jgi:hypothetical protein
MRALYYLLAAAVVLWVVGTVAELGERAATRRGPARPFAVPRPAERAGPPPSVEEQIRERLGSTKPRHTRVYTAGPAAEPRP